MRCLNKSFKLILGGILFMSLLAGCGGGNINSESTNNASSSSEPKQPKSITTDSAAQVSFITTQGQTVIFEIRDNYTQQPLSGISITFTEKQNSTFSVNLEDPSGNYLPTNFVGSLPKADTSKKTEASLFKLGLERI